MLSNLQIPKRMDKEKLKSRLEVLIVKDKKGCWLFQGYICYKGYGRFWIQGNTSKLAHRVSFAMYKGRIRKDKVIDHKCGVKHCVNPEHLQAISQSKNVKLGYKRNEKR